ncbi:hypothetical protein [Leclercia sp.]|uniref:hypothetical protein n=1 Tax=Leclercia sp. TaxID=1898428 RepID=UPI002FDE16C2
MKAKVAIVVAVLLLAGCSTKASRMGECLNEGNDRDTCSQIEGQRQAAILGASMGAAFNNANAAANTPSTSSSSNHKHHHQKQQYQQNDDNDSNETDNDQW